MASRKPRRKGGEDEQTRIAIVSNDKCKPKKCALECKKSCPVVRMGKMCIEVAHSSKIAKISEDLCIGCGICVKKCPYEAITIINLPKNLESSTTHRHGPNAFKLHRCCVPRASQVLGLVGTNGIGKSTCLKILAGKLKPNLGLYAEPPSWEDILTYFRGSELQGYFTRLLEEDMSAAIKPQYVDQLPRAVKGEVGRIIAAKDKRGVGDQLARELQLDHLLERQVGDLSGGELQRFAICVVAVQNADIYMFDEPSSYLDVKQRMRAAGVIRDLLEQEDSSRKYVIAVEHDLAVLDYLSDFICCLYGTPGVYGVVTMPFSVREGINIFLAGFVPTENLRFRNEELSFKVAGVDTEGATSKKKRGKGGAAGADEEEDTGLAAGEYAYPEMHKVLRSAKKDSTFTLHVESGVFTDSQIIVMLGENGTGKTTFIRMLAGLMEADADPTTGEVPDVDGFSVSYKPQKIAPKFDGSVRALLHAKIRDAHMHPQFATDVTKPLELERLLDSEVKTLSGGELQRVALVLCLGKPADVYLIDEPSAYLDSEQRIVAAKVIKRFILHAKKVAFVVEHDFIMATYLADRVIVYSGNPGIEATAHSPEPLISGMNSFLESIGITFRRDPTNYRPRINKKNSDKDREQKRAGTYFYADE